MTREPVYYATLVRVVLYAAVTFGLPLSEEQMLAVVAVVEVACSLFVRSKVTPVERAVSDDGAFGESH